MTKVTTAEEFRTAVKENRNAYYQYDDYESFPTQIVYDEDEGITVNTRAVVEPKTVERFGDIIDYVRKVFGDDAEVTVEHITVASIDSAVMPHSIDRYKVEVK